MGTFLTIILSIFVFGLFITLHELGHYLTARMFDVHIKEFSIGMGPKIFSRVSDKTGIRYSFRAFLFGGYVSMVGEDEDSDDPRALSKKPVWQRMIITAAGGVTNIIVGFILTFAMVLSVAALGSTVIADFSEGAVSSDKLMVEDKIISVHGKRCFTHMDVAYEIARFGIEPCTVVVERNGERITLEDVVFGIEESSGTQFGQMDFIVYRVEKNFKTVMGQTLAYCRLDVKQVWESLYDLVRGRYGAEAVSGPIGAAKTIGEAARVSFSTFIYLIGLISVNLGLVNLLPFPALDGGRLVFQFIELITRKKVPSKVEAMIHAIGLIVLLGLMVVITGKDIIKLFRR